MNLLNIRENIYNYFRSTKSCQKYFFAPEREDDYVTYYTSMCLLQDTSELLMIHRQKVFSENAHIAYVEFLGVIQAIFI